MTVDELYEEIRAQLREAQEGAVAKPWRYGNADIVPQVRSALRHLRVLGVPLAPTMTTAGVLSEELTETQGLLVALRVVQRLLSGDLVQKLLDGELGVVYRSGADYVDTKTASMAFTSLATSVDEEFQRYLMIALANADGGSNSIFGLQTEYVET